MNTLKKALIAGALAASILASAIPAFASNSGDGSDYGTQPGYNIANDNTVCAGHGSFNYFGKEWNLGNEQSGHYGSGTGPGADGTQTGINNSSLCGNPQN